MAKPKYNDIGFFWRVAPKRLKVFVKHQILNNGYGNDKSGNQIAAHIWECLKYDVSPSCCMALIRHYDDVKRIASKSSLGNVATLSAVVSLQKTAQGVWDDLIKEQPNGCSK